MVIKKLSQLVVDYFNCPSKVLASCLVLSFFLLIADGTLIRLWGTYKNKERMGERISQYKKEIQNLEEQLHLANQPEFVEKRARDRFDLVGKGEIVFVFPENESSRAD